MKTDEQEKEANPLISPQMEICLMSSTSLSPCSCVHWQSGGETCPLCPRASTCVSLIANQSASTTLALLANHSPPLCHLHLWLADCRAGTLPLGQPACGAAGLMGRDLIGCCGWWAPPAPPPSGSWWGTSEWGLIFRWWPDGMEGRGWLLKNGFVNRELGG